MKRREAREKAIQTLYHIDISKTDWQEALKNVLDGRKSDPFLEETLEGIVAHIGDIDQTLHLSLTNWKLERLPLVDRAILRLAVYELKFNSVEVPHQVVMNEAVELAKSFGTEESSKFVNGVLSNVVKQGE